MTKENIFVLISLPFNTVGSLKYNLGGKTTICDGRAFRHDGDETLSGDGRGDHSISSTILKILKSKSGFVLNRWRASGSQLSEKEPTCPVLSLGGNLTNK